MKKILIAIFAVATACAQTTLVQQTLVDATGHKQSGQVTLSWPNFTTAPAAGSVVVSAGKMTRAVVNGNLTLPLYPTTGATSAGAAAPGGVAYTVKLVLDGTTSDEIWDIPKSAIPVTRTSVIISQIPSINTQVDLSQLPQSGATDKQVIGWDDIQKKWLPITVNTSSSVPDNSVSTVKLQDSAVTDQKVANGLSGSKLQSGSVPDSAIVALDGSKLTGNSVPNSALQTGIDGSKLQNSSVPGVAIGTGVDAIKVGDGSVSSTEFQRLSGVTSGIQSQINGREVKKAAVYVDDYCSTPGVYDDTCWNLALASISVPTKLYAGGHTYVANAQILVSGKTDLEVYSLDRSTLIQAKNALNVDLFKVLNCIRCDFSGINLDGNGANQTSGTVYTLHIVTSTVVNYTGASFVNPYQSTLMVDGQMFSSGDNIQFSNNKVFVRAGVNSIPIQVNAAQGVGISNNYIQCTANRCVKYNNVYWGGQVSNNRFDLKGLVNVFKQSLSAVKVTAGTPFTPVRVNAGGSSGTDSVGNSWIATCGTYTSFSATGTTANPISNADPADQFIYQSWKYRTGGGQLLFEYNNMSGYTACPGQWNTPGMFVIRLRFSDNVSTGAGQRVQKIVFSDNNGTFNINLETSLDVYAQAGGANKALVKTYVVYLPNPAQFVLWFYPVVGNYPFVNGVEAFPIPSSSVGVSMDALQYNVGTTGSVGPSATVTGSGDTSLTWRLFGNINTSVSGLTLNSATGVVTTAGAYDPTILILIASSNADPTQGDFAIVYVRSAANSLSPELSPATSTITSAGTKSISGSYTGGDANPSLSYYSGDTCGAYGTQGASLSVTSGTSTLFTAPITAAPRLCSVTGTTNFSDWGIIDLEGANGINIVGNLMMGLDYSVKRNNFLGGSNAQSTNFVGNSHSLGGDFGPIGIADSGSSFFGGLASGNNDVAGGPFCNNNTCPDTTSYPYFTENISVDLATCVNGTPTWLVSADGATPPTLGGCLGDSAARIFPYVVFSKTTSGYIYVPFSYQRTPPFATYPTTTASNSTYFFDIGGYFSANDGSNNAVIEVDLGCMAQSNNPTVAINWRTISMSAPFVANTPTFMFGSGYGVAFTPATFGTLQQDGCFVPGSKDILRIWRVTGNALDTTNTDLYITRFKLIKYVNNAQN